MRSFERVRRIILRFVRRIEFFWVRSDFLVGGEWVGTWLERGGRNVREKVFGLMGCRF